MSTIDLIIAFILGMFIGGNAMLIILAAIIAGGDK